jgi:hypothetical protein
MLSCTSNVCTNTCSKCRTNRSTFRLSDSRTDGFANNIAKWTSNTNTVGITDCFAYHISNAHAHRQADRGTYGLPYFVTKRDAECGANRPPDFSAHGIALC